MAAKANEPEKETQGKHYLVNIDLIEPFKRAGGNLRTVYGDIKELSENIRINGIKKPLDCFRNPDKKGYWFCFDGHRRLEAARMTGEIIMAKVMAYDERKLSDEELIYNMINANTGKSLTFPEQAEGIRRLIAQGVENKEIASRIGKPKVYVDNLELLAASPAKIRKMVENDNISYTLVQDIFRTTRDFNEAVALIQSAFDIAKANKEKKEKGNKPKGKPNHEIEFEEEELKNKKDDDSDSKVRIRKKDLDKAKNITNSYKALEKAFKNAEKKGWMKNPDNKELFEFCSKIHTGKFTQEQLEAKLFLADEEDEDSED